MSYMETRPILVCVDEDVQVSARIEEHDDMDAAVRLVATELTGKPDVKIDLLVERRVWRDWVRAIDRLIRAEDRAARQRAKRRKTQGDEDG